MLRIRIAVLVIAVFAAAASAYAAGQAKAREIRREAIEWTDVWMPNLKNNDLPRVLLIGDSITRGYYDGVEQNLKGKAYCARIATSKAVGDPALLAELATLIAEERFAVVHFNIGMHGWDYTEDEYRKGLPALLKTIRRAAPAAKLTWASTTPVGKDFPGDASNPRIEARNAAAREYFTRQGIPVDDLNGLMAAHPGMHTDGVHFTAEGSKLLAAQVAREVEKALPAIR